MRAKPGQTPAETAAGYLGEIAPLLRAAREVESLSELEKKRVRRRILRSAFGSRSGRRRLRLSPVLVGVGLLVAGGVAFATAERLGLIRAPFQGPPSPPNKAVGSEGHKRRSHAGHALGQTAQAVAPVEQPAALVTLPELPDPLLVPAAPVNPLPWASSAAASTPSPISVRKVQPRSRALPGIAGTRAALAAPGVPHPRVAMRTPYLAEPAGGPADQSRLARAPGPSAIPLEPVGLAASAPALAAAAPAALPTPPPKLPATDSALFGQALRKLRNEKDPEAALSALDDHARAYPRSALAGERNALQVEALLALHRDREALAKLDGMVLEELPRSGERFVVRGELRAAARRWQDARADFEHALSRVSGSPAWHERALWGRGVSRLRCGDQEEGMADIERYRDLYPKGRFAGEASRFFPNQ